MHYKIFYVIKHDRSILFIFSRKNSYDKHMQNKIVKQ